MRSNGRRPLPRGDAPRSDGVWDHKVVSEAEEPVDETPSYRLVGVAHDRNHDHHLL